MRGKSELLLSLYSRNNSYRILRSTPEFEIDRFKLFELNVTKKQLLEWNNVAYLVKGNPGEQIILFLEVQDGEVIQSHYIRGIAMDWELALYIYKAFLHAYIKTKFIVSPAIEM